MNVKVDKRCKFEIYFDILNSLHSELNKYDNVSPTRVAYNARMPYDRFQKRLGKLIQLGMVSRVGDRFVVTEKGLEYMTDFKKMLDSFYVNAHPK